MDRRKAGEPLNLRAQMMQQVAESERGKRAKSLLQSVIERYFTLTAEQRKRFKKLLDKNEYREAREMEVTWEDEIAEKARARGREEGREEGRHSGLMAGKRKPFCSCSSRSLDLFPNIPSHDYKRWNRSMCLMGI